MATGNQDLQASSSLSHLKKHSKIISFSNGNLELDENNLDKLISSVDHRKNDPVALISVVGPVDCGKSFYTNLLIRFLQHDGATRWITKLFSNIEPLVGFSYGNVNSSENIVPDGSSGIYLWPESFQLLNYSNGSLILWVLHLHLNKEDREDEAVVGLLNILLNLLSSKIVEISRDTTNKFTFLKTRSQLLSKENVRFSKEMMCKSVVHIFRTTYRPSKVILSKDSEAVEHLRKLIPEASVSSLEGLDCVRVAHISDNEKPLHDQSGFLSLHTKMYDRLDDVIKLIGDYKYIHPKLDNDGMELRLEQLMDYIKDCVYHVNHEFSSDQMKTTLSKVTHLESEIISSPAATLEDKEDQTLPEQEGIFRTLYDEENDKLAVAAVENLEGCLEVDEELRILQEKAEKLVVDATVEIQNGMLADLNKWLNLKLIPATINDCEKIYEKQFQQVRNDIKYREALGMKQVAIDKFNNLLREKTEDTRKAFDVIQECVTNFHSRIHEKTATHGYFSESKFNELIEEEFQRTSKETRLKNDELTTEYVHRACNKLTLNYKYHNKRIFVEEDYLIQTMCESLKLWYNEEMSRILTESYFSPTQLLKIHSHLTKTFTSSLTTAFQYQSGESTKFIKEKSKLVTKQLAEEFKRHKQANRLKLEKLQKETDRLIQCSVSMYNDTMVKSHEAAQKEARVTLENEIRKQIDGAEPVEVHLQALQNHIDKACSSLIRKKGARGVTKKGEATSSSSSLQLSSCTRQTNDMNNGLPQQKVCLSPLIFHLSSNHVRVGIEHDNSFVPLPPVPAVIGVTNEGEWVCGANEKMQEEATKVWLIRECRHPWCEKIEIGDNVHEITVEFLLGFLFQTLKQQVEEAFNGEIGKAIFIIPFWFTSSQRQQVKDAGTAAGFTETLLINENSAIAFRATNKCNQISDIVVISENSGHVDVTVYAYDKPKENLKMRGHYAVYEKNEKQRKQRSSMFSWDYWKSEAFGVEVSDSKGNAVHDAYKLAMRQADSWKMTKSDRSRPKHVVVSFESENWKDVLVRTAQGINEKASFSCLPCDGVVEGMGVVSLNPVVFYQVVQDINPINNIEKMVQDNNNALPLDGGTKLLISSDLVIYASNACFYQKGIDGEGGIGDLKLAASMEDGLVKLEVTNEGIIQLYSVNAKSKYDYRTRSSGDKFALKSDQYTWTTPNLNPDQIGSYASLLEYFKDA